MSRIPKIVKKAFTRLGRKKNANFLEETPAEALQSSTYPHKTNPFKFYKIVGSGSSINYTDDTKQESWKAINRKTGNLVFLINVSPLCEAEASLKIELPFPAVKKHPNLLHLIDYFLKEEVLWTVYEFMDEDDLTQLCNPSSNWQESAMAYVCKQILQALDFLHQSHVIHSNVKSDNVLIDSNGNIKLSEFDNYKIKDARPSSTPGATPYWMAPEIIKSEPQDGKVDIWGLGITTLEMSDGKPPRIGLGPLKAMLAIINNPSPEPEVPDKWSTEFNHFLPMTLKKNPVERSSAKDLLLHPFLTRAMQPLDFAAFVQDLKSSRSVKPTKFPKRETEANADAMHAFNQIFDEETDE